ncbi:hypothetical protein ACFY2R_13190 [Micromonospora olivasterospora]|uniref:Uncharacterized protein n=1 Tax=Micromonospora olivasterospora TaxID=1880 RepID=A0A562IAB5_MICOL|nr:hypothetical protein [Micromonospora olivasterospora]TWH67969.1 hypothetical protein JD77_02956 [Micromonospora olivasterospora]
MTTPTALDVTAVLDRYRAGLRTVTDVELGRRAATVAALPGRLADERGTFGAGGEGGADLAGDDGADRTPPVPGPLNNVLPK